MTRFLFENPSWCQENQSQIRQSKGGSELVSMWEEQIKERSCETDLRVLFSAERSSSYTMPLRRELVELVGPEDSDALFSNLQTDNETLACLGPVAGVPLLAEGKLERQQYLDLWGHRGPNEFELSMTRLAEDPAWQDQKLDQYNESPFKVNELLESQRKKYHSARHRLQERYPEKASSLFNRIAESAQRARKREAVCSELALLCWVMRDFGLRAGELLNLGETVFFLTLTELLNLMKTGYMTYSSTRMNKKHTNTEKLLRTRRSSKAHQDQPVASKEGSYVWMIQQKRRNY